MKGANAAAIKKTRLKKKTCKAKRAEFWVTEDLTREEKKIIQEWMPEIIEDARTAIKQGAE